MENQNSRTEMLIGIEGQKRLCDATVAVFGVGGVGGYAAEAIARAGVGKIHLIDSDTVSLSNINRQIIATHNTVGMYKTDAMRERILSINPDATVVCHSVFFDENTKTSFDFSNFDYVIDAIDSLSAKIELIVSSHEAGTPIISAMGAGNKLDPTRFEVSDISKTTVCPLARAVRIALRKRGINHLKVVYSKEDPVIPPEVSDGQKKRVPGSISFVPSVMGLIIAGEVIKDIAIK
jgi:tRNA A37 threonylcarbamoyladenosine dehydratase